MKLQIVDEGPLYRNPQPGYRAACAYLPNIVPLSDDELLCFYRMGQAFYSADGHIALLRSCDGGKSWMDDGMILGGDGFTYTAPHGALLRDGTLLLVARRHPSLEDQLLRFNPDTGGSRPSDTLLLFSSDRGRTWTEPRCLPPSESPGVADTPSSVLELEDGSWFLPFEMWKEWDDPSPLHIKGFALFSNDHGKTWGERIDFPSARDPSRMYSHTRYSQMLDGRICGTQWAQDIGGHVNYDLHFVISDRTGRHWGLPRPTGIRAQTSWVRDLGEGNLAVAYTSREGMSPGVFVALSNNEGRTWSLEDQVQVWDAVGQEFLGVAHKPSYPASHDNIAFGKPNLARLPSGELIASWWCTQACITHIRYTRLRVV